jgi:hypothetical protein
MTETEDVGFRKPVSGIRTTGGRIPTSATMVTVRTRKASSRYARYPGTRLAWGAMGTCGDVAATAAPAWRVRESMVGSLRAALPTPIAVPLESAALGRRRRHVCGTMSAERRR